MALIPYEPFRNLEQWRREMDRFFHEVPNMIGHSISGPRVDIFERENEVIASCEIPGLEKKDDVLIEVQDNLLTISGSVNRSNEEKEEQMHRRERYIGKFQRSIGLPARVMSEGTKATYKNGILEVRMPKEKSDDKRRIEVDFH